LLILTNEKSNVNEEIPLAIVEIKPMVKVKKEKESG